MGNPWAPPEHPPTGGPADDPSQQPTQRPTERVPGQPWSPPAGHAHAPVPAPTGPGATPPPDPQAVARATRTAAWAAAVLLVSAILLGSRWPGALVAPPVAAAGLVVALVALVRGLRARARGTDLALPVALVVVGFLWTTSAAQTYLYADVLRDAATCTTQAVTDQAQRECTESFTQARRERLEELLGTPVPLPTP